ncbi:LysR substrate-binding domain-containing protein, partial [Pseudomonas sp. MOB-449]|nr:LysR substrate-binding domain-containing protein [Pseudomonas sp. MOB-449]
AEYVARHGRPLNLAELAGHRGVAYLSATSGQLQPLEFSAGGRIERIDLPATLAVNNGEAYVAACAAGLGLIQVPRYHV